jgi:BirA family biotin operon repressor/biotin-[acetyl-CoA-carboxylase] ligase
MAAFTVIHFEKAGSTNDEARRLAREGAPHGTAVHADEQTEGRGRLTRRWFSPPGNLYLSVVLRLDVEPTRRSELGFVVALAVAETVNTLLPRQTRASLKWPNDVLVGGAKIAGILLEAVEDGVVIAGMGLNILHAPAGTAYRTTTIAASGGVASVDTTRDTLLDRLEAHLMVWENEGFAPIRQAWLDQAHPIGTMLRVMRDGHIVEGAFAGLGQDGALLLDNANGRVRVIAGDVETG